MFQERVAVGEEKISTSNSKHKFWKNMNCYMMENVSFIRLKISVIKKEREILAVLEVALSGFPFIENKNVLQEKTHNVSFKA